MELLIIFLSFCMSSLSLKDPSLRCDFHEEYCFYVQKMHAPVTSVEDAKFVCKRERDGWPLEIYDSRLYTSVKWFLGTLDSSYAHKNVLLNTKRIDGGWHYVQNGFHQPTLDFKLEHSDDVVYYNSNNDKFETGWYHDLDLDLPYLCSNRNDSGHCSRENSFFADWQCITFHSKAKSWRDAQNDCASRAGFLALISTDHKVSLKTWLSRWKEGYQFWIGLAWRPLQWIKNGSLVTWTNFKSDLRLQNIPNEIFLQINVDKNQWKVDVNASLSEIVVCMTNNIAGNKTNESIGDKISNATILATIVSVTVVAVAVCLLAAALLVRWKRRRNENVQPAVNKTVKSTDYPIYLEPLTDLYEHPYDYIILDGDGKENKY